MGGAIQGYDIDSFEGKVLSNQYVYNIIQTRLNSMNLFVTMLIGGIIALILGIQMLLSGIANTRLGNQEHIMEKRKLLLNLGYAIAIACIIIFLIYTLLQLV